MSQKIERSGIAPEWHVVFNSHENQGQHLVINGDTQGLEIEKSRQECKITVIFEGFLYDRKQLLKELGLNPLFEGSTATLIRRAWQLWNVDLFRRLRGRYLIAVHEEESGNFYICHDAMGQHPVYYSQNGDKFIFSSNIFALAYSGWVDRKVNRLSVALHLTIGNINQGETSFQNIQRLRPYRYLKVIFNGKIEERIFISQIHEDGELEISPETAFEMFQEEFQRSITRCMEYRPEGILFSGGVDSVSVAAIATSYTREKGLPALTACCGQTPPDFTPSWEDGMQKRSATLLHMRYWPTHAGIWLKGRPLMDATLDENLRHPGPADAWWCGAYINFHRTVASYGLKHVLTGSGGDEWLGLHPAYAADLMRGMNIYQLGKLFLAETRTGPFGGLIAARNIFWRYGAELLLRGYLGKYPFFQINTRHLGEKRFVFPPWMIPDPKLKDEIISVMQERSLTAVTEKGSPPASYYRHAINHVAKYSQIHQEFERQFHINRSIGLTFHHPYHDIDLIRTCSRFPAANFVYHGSYKSLSRTLVTKTLPGIGFENQKKNYPKSESQGYIYQELLRRSSTMASDSSLKELFALGLIDETFSKNEDNGTPDSLKEAAEKAIILTTARWIGHHCT